jgi:selenocysteine lyase/cysteine desulfurase
VHYAPHALIDVKAWDCDFATCSAYKFFGPHVGILWGRRRLLEQAPVYKLRPPSNALPDRWMTGTQNHEGIAGTVAAIDYLASIGREHGDAQAEERDALRTAYEVTRSYERGLAEYMIGALDDIPEVRVWGITDPARFDARVTTVAFTHERRTPDSIAARLGDAGIFVWHGNFYALPLTQTLELEPAGVVRVGLLHYNTREEIDRLLEAVRAF